MDGLVKRVCVCERLVGEVMGLEIAPDGFRCRSTLARIWQPFQTGEPMGAVGERRLREFAGVDWTIILDQHHRLGGLSGLGTVELVQSFEMGDKVAAAFGLGSMHDELAGLYDRREPSIATFFACPGAGTRRSAPIIAQARAR